MIRFLLRMAARLWILCVIAFLVLVGCLASRSVHAMSARDILYLNKFGEGISNVSWCNDQAFTFVTHGSPQTPRSVFPPEYSRETTVSMFAIETQEIRPIIVSEYAAFGADCVRNGEYVFLNGYLNSAISKDARLPAQVPFSQFIDVRPRTGSPAVTPVLRMRRDYLALSSPLRTAPDGSVYAEASSDALDLDSVVPSKRASVIEKGLNYSLTRDGVRTTYATAGSDKPSPGPFPVYGFSAPEILGIGTYGCTASRPGCALASVGPSVGYYLYTKVNTDRARLDVLFTLSPRHDPYSQRWPLVGGSGTSWERLTISGVALDAKSCYVLLEPRPDLAISRINEHLRLDLYLAQCRFNANQLQFDEPRIVGQKQASFIIPRLSLHGEFAVITETFDLASQVDDQIELEKAPAGRPNICARFFHIGPWPLVPVNTICVRVIQGGASGLTVSPDGGYVDVQSKTSPLIVGREFRNDGTAPVWLNHGENP